VGSAGDVWPRSDELLPLVRRKHAHERDHGAGQADFGRGPRKKEVGPVKEKKLFFFLFPNETTHNSNFEQPKIVFKL
jgi:hypothetical protein